MGVRIGNSSQNDDIFHVNGKTGPDSHTFSSTTMNDAPGHPIRKLRAEEIAQHRLSSENVATAPRVPVIGMLDNIRSLYNVGSMFRTADGALLQHLYLTGYTPTPPRKEIEKTALGATGTVPWTHFANPLEAVQAARSAGARICVLEQTTRSIPYSALESSLMPLCLVVGNELNGIHPDVVALADLAIEIPMYGTKHSLNAAVAFGIAVFELARLWREKEGG
jgi:23S rRNA (guanosine2251-2'-O)-methyltransferase